MLTIQSAQAYFTDLGNSIWKCRNTIILGHGMLSYYCSVGSAPYFGLALYGLPLTNEIGISGHPGCVLQVFERGVLIYDPGHTIDNPPGSGAVYPAHIDSGVALAELLSLFGPKPVDMSSILTQTKALQAEADKAFDALIAALGAQA